MDGEFEGTKMLPYLPVCVLVPSPLFNTHFGQSLVSFPFSIKHRPLTQSASAFAVSPIAL